MYLCTQVEITEMKKERETANKYRQQALEGDLMAMNNMGVCYAQGIGVVEDHVMAFQWYMKAAELGDTSHATMWQNATTREMEWNRTSKELFIGI